MLKIQSLVFLTTGSLLCLQGQGFTSPERNANAQSQLRALLGPQGLQVSAESFSSPMLPAVELQIQWDATVGPPAAPPPPSASGYRSPHRVVARRARPAASRAPALRSVELSSYHLLVAVVDGNSVLKSWSVIPDPRILRSEETGPDGVLTGRFVAVPLPDISVEVPADPSLAEIRLFEARSSATGVQLRLVAVLPAQ